MAGSLSQLVRLAADRAVSQNERLAGFTALADEDGMTVRRFYRAEPNLEQEISVYRDKWWTKAGGTAHVELFCLVASYQVAMSGLSQSWRTPIKDVPFHHFQHALSDANPTWTIANAADVQTFEDGLSQWLDTVAIPWFALFESDDGVIQYLAMRGLHAQAARFLASLGRIAEARNCVRKYVSTLPRQADREFEALKKAGLLSEDDFRHLSRASLQHVDRYQSLIHAWIANYGNS